MASDSLNEDPKPASATAAAPAGVETAPAAHPAARPRSRVWRSILLGCLMVAAVFLAWQLHILLFQADGRSAAPVRREAPAPPAPQNSDPKANPEGFLLQPQQEMLQPFAGDPAGIAPPAGARPTGGAQQHAHKMSQWYRSYQWQGTVAQAQDHYRRQLEAAGFRAVAAGQDDDGGWQGEFLKEDVHVTVRLGKLNAGDKTIRIAVTAVSGL